MASLANSYAPPFPWIADRKRAPFTHFLQEFDLTALDRRERTAGFEGAVFAYPRTPTALLCKSTGSQGKQNAL